MTLNGTAFSHQASRTASMLSTATLASLGGASSRRGSCDTNFSVETEASVRDMKVICQSVINNSDQILV